MAQPGPEANDSLRLRESFSVVQVHGTRPGVGAQRRSIMSSCRESSEAMAWCVASKRARSPNDVDADQTEPPFALTPVPHIFGLWRVCFPPCLVRPGRPLDFGLWSIRFPPVLVRDQITGKIKRSVNLVPKMKNWGWMWSGFLDENTPQGHGSMHGSLEFAPGTESAGPPRTGAAQISYHTHGLRLERPRGCSSRCMRARREAGAKRELVL